GRPAHDALLAPAALLLAYQLDEAVLLELAHVVGHLLAREPQGAGHRRGRARLGQRLQDPLPERRRQHGRLSGIVDEVDGGHGGTLTERPPFDKKYFLLSSAQHAGGPAGLLLA